MRIVVAVFLIAAWIAFGVYYLRYRPVSPPASDRRAAAAVPVQPAKPAAPAAVAGNPGRDVVMEPVRRDVRNVTPDRVLPGPALRERMIARLPAAEPEPEPPQPPKPQAWPRVAVLSAGVVRSKETEIIFSGIDPLAIEAECKAGDGSAWRCGNFARAALQRLIRQRTIECEPAVPGDDDAAAKKEGAERADSSITARCRVSGRDIGEWLVTRGWALPLSGSGYEEAFKKAKKAGRGQWRRDNPEKAQGF